MSEKQVFIVQPAPHPSRSLAVRAVQEAPEGRVITIAKPKRSNVLNAKMWAVLTQLEPIEWYGNRLTKEEWKDVITASLKRQKIVPGIDGGFVVCGLHTRDMPSGEIWDVIDTAYALGSERGIRFIEPIESLRGAA
jgi:hypothetical protein